MNRYLVVCLLAALPAQAEVYKCVVGGQPVYADAPCKPDAKPIPLKQGLAPEPRAYYNMDGVRDVKVGMTAQQVRELCGSPDRINTTEYRSGHHEQWVYGFLRLHYYVYLENGIVTAVQH